MTEPGSCTDVDADNVGESSEFPVLRTRRLCLRAFRESDFDAFYALHSNPHVMRYWSFPAWTDTHQAAEYFASALGAHDPGSMLCWAVALPGDDRLIGGVTLHAINSVQGRAEVGYSLHPDHWGFGYAKEALNAALAYTFDVLRLRRVQADTDPRNQRSCRLLQSLGFQREGILRESWNVAGEISDSAIYGLVFRDWRADR